MRLVEVARRVCESGPVDLSADVRGQDQPGKAVDAHDSLRSGSDMSLELRREVVAADACVIGERTDRETAVSGLDTDPMC